MYAQVILLKSEPMHVTKKKSTGTNLIPLIISRESDVCNNDLWVNRKEITFVVVFWGCIYLSLFYFLPTLHPLLHNVLNSDNIFRWKNFTVKEVIIRLWISLHYYLCSRFGAFLQNSQGLFFLLSRHLHFLSLFRQTWRLFFIRLIFVLGHQFVTFMKNKGKLLCAYTRHHTYCI